MKLHQLKIDYTPEQDRLLMQIATSDGLEVRSWLTRRFVKLLWPMLVKLAEETNPRIASQASAEARNALLGIEHEQAISKADFSKPFQPAPRATPLGDEPLLLARIQTGRDAKGLPVVALHPADGQGLTLTFDAVLLHSVCRLLQAAAQKSDWDLKLQLPNAEARPDERVRRTIN